MNSADWETHFATLRYIVRGEWDQLQELSLGFCAEDLSFCQFLIEQHAHHFVVGRLDKDHQAELLPAQWIAVLRAQLAKYQDARNRLREKLAEACRALTDAGIEYRILKGIPFAQKYLSNINLRRSADIDLLVAEKDIDRVLKVLWKPGCQTDPPCVKMTGNGPVIEKSALRKGHELTFVLDGIHVDLHWRFRTAPGYRWRDSEIWAYKEQVDVDGTLYPVLSDEYALVVLLVSIAHDIARGGCRLKHLLDVHHMLSCQSVHIDWPKFLEDRKVENNLKMSVNVLRMILDVWNEQSECPQLRAALAPYEGLLIPDSGKTRALALVQSPRSGVENKLWFAQVYGVQWNRDAKWILLRSARFPRRWPIALARMAEYTAKQLLRAARSILPPSVGK